MTPNRKKGGWAASLLVSLLVSVSLSACGNPDPSYYGSSSYNRASDAPVGVVVQKGDTVYAISRRYGVTPRGIIEANRLKAPYTLYPGDRLSLPAPRAHKVRKGETVYGISRDYGVDMKTLAAINGIKPPYTIEVGQKLVVPARGQKLASAAPPAKSKRTAPTQSAPQRKPVSSSPKPVASVPRAPVKPLATPPPRSSGQFGWPAKGSLISSFGPKANGLHNDGINIAVAVGTPVRAAEAGVVAYAGNELRGYGNLVLIKHSGGWTSAYAHNSSVAVKRGQKVRRGDIIARSGQSGGVAQPQLHFELRKGTRAVDPKRYLASG